MSALAIVGPTASGKTALSIPLAERLGAEIISMDSRQVYRRMEIGTDKVAPALRALVPHHGLDLVDPDARYSAGRFARDARRWMAEIEGRGRLPLLVGGTGFFLRALTDPIFREPALDPDRREGLRAHLKRIPPEELSRWVDRLDPARAPLARVGGSQRLLRTLEVALLTGHPLSWWHRNAPLDAPAVPIRIVLLTLPREELMRRIDARGAAMFARGLLDEVRGLLEAGYTPSDPGMTATGYREAVDVLEGRRTEAEALVELQRVTRAYARRQLTWFRHQLSADRLLLDAEAPISRQLDAVFQWLAGPGRTGAG